MEVREFIESGILELYVLDELNTQERASVFEMAQSHAEVREEIKSIEASFLHLAEAGAVEPQQVLYEKIQSRLSFSDSANRTNVSPVKPLIPTYPVKFYAYALAACFTLLLLSAVGLYTLWSELNLTRQQLNELTTQNRLYGSQIAYLKNEQKTSRSIIHDPDYRKLALLGTPLHPQQRAVVFWNTKRHTVLLDAAGLANTDKRHSYQLWAIVNGKPVSAGVFDVKGDLSPILKLNDISTAQAFAVTLEPLGGSEKPTMSAMYVMGAI